MNYNFEKYKEFEEKIINGKKIANILNLETRNQLNLIKNKYNKILCLNPIKYAIICVGANEASLIYIKNKKKKSEELGICCDILNLQDDISQNGLNNIIENLNNDKNIFGILIQMPLPKHLCIFDAIIKIKPEKDIDGFHPMNSGLLNICAPTNKILVPCTPQACLFLIKSCFENQKDPLAGKRILIIGRSNIVGWPLAKLLINENAVITVAHSFEKNLKSLCLQNEIIVCATGYKYLLKEDMTHSNHIIIDVGINKTQNNDGSFKIIGDADFENIIKKVKKITPVPFGVGPMTIAFLMKNILKSYLIQNNLFDDFFNNKEINGFIN
jgi:methylenetetrahydrofolate dehydrogenase (NADP+)/methenyltetrahydrofolate cyclohydrolase